MTRSIKIECHSERSEELAVDVVLAVVFALGSEIGPGFSPDLLLRKFGPALAAGT
jgi:hypothetical protein